VTTAGSRIEGLGAITTGYSMATRKFFIDFNANRARRCFRVTDCWRRPTSDFGQRTAQVVCVDSTSSPSMTYTLLDEESNPVDDQF